MKKMAFFIFALLIVDYSFALKESYEIFFRALIMEKEGKYDMAMEYYKKAIALDPQLFLYKQALNLALQMGKVKESKEYSQYIVNIDSSSAENWFLYGNSLWALGEIGAAKQAFEKVIALDPEYADAYYQLSSLNFDNAEKAVSYLHKFMELRPDYKAEIFYQIALIYQSKNDIKKMMEYIRKSIEEDEFYLKPKYLLASYYESKNDFKSAIEEYNKILKLDSKNTELLNHLGEIYLSPTINDIEKASSYFNMAVEIDSSNPTALYWLSLISEEKKEYEKAVLYLERSREIELNPSIALKLSYYYTLTNNYHKALSLLEKLHLKWPQNWEISYFLALGYEDIKKYDRAYDLLSDVVAKNPDHEDAILQLAVVCEKLNNVPCFEENFRKLLLKKPDNAMVLNYLGYSLIDRGLKLEEAIEMVKKALEKEPENGAYLDSLGWGYYKKGDYEKAIENIEKSVRVIKYDSVVWEHLGELWDKKDDVDRAWLAYKISTALSDDKKEEINKTLKRLYEKILIPDSIYKYWDTFSLKGVNFNTFFKMTVHFKKKNIKIDGIIYQNENGKFGISLIGPLMTPIWQVEYADNLLRISDLNIDGVENETFKKFAREVFLGLKDFFAGEIIKAPYSKITNKFLRKENIEIRFSDNSAYIDKMTFKKEYKFEFVFRKFEYIKGYLFPTLWDIKAPYVNITFEIEPSKINIDKMNDLLRNWL